jgi:hypothetical protein
MLFLCYYQEVGFFFLVYLLLQRCFIHSLGADPTLKSNSGTALQLARSKNLVDVISILESFGVKE